MKLVLISIVALVLFSAGAVVAGSLHQKSSPLKSQALDWSLPKLGGNKASLSDYKGKVVMMNFWASWCGTCRDEMPDIVNLYNKYKDQEFVVLGLDYGEQDSEAKQFATQYGMNFPIFMDYNKSVAAKYNVLSTPVSYLIDRSGVIREYAPGHIDPVKTEEALKILLLESK